MHFPGLPVLVSLAGQVILPLLDLLLGPPVLRLLPLLLGPHGVLVIPDGHHHQGSDCHHSPGLEPEPGRLHHLHLAVEHVRVLLVSRRIRRLLPLLLPLLVSNDKELIKTEPYNTISSSYLSAIGSVT